MRDFLRLVRKEVRELLRPRYILPILLVPLMFVAMGQGIGGISDEVDDQPSVGMVVNDTSEHAQTVLSVYNASADVTYLDRNVDPATALNETRAAGGTSLLVIPEGFGEAAASPREQGEVRVFTDVDSVGIAGIAEAGQGTAPLSAAGTAITMNVTNATAAQLQPITTSETTYVKGARLDRAPGALSDALGLQFLFIPLMIVMVIVFSGQMVMNSMGTENENKTLETLLTMPVARRTIVAAKLVGSASVGLFGAAVFIGSLFYYQSSLSTGGGTALPEAFTLGTVDYAVIAIAVALAIVGALALALCLGIFAGDQQGAQVLVFPLAILAGAPAMFSAFTDITALSLPLRAVMYVNPFTYPALAPKQLIFGDPMLVFAGVAYEAVFAVGMVALAVRLFGSDRVVTGDAGRLSDVFSSLQR
jgi:ABC-2 type transport system permease protein